jgi:2-polyprenyl-3-methyl-5-hydroxy-6-metoxy-1,4-benzoquinol methylase
MGQGRNALYLASLGWRVTGIDISDEGIRQAREAAAARLVDRPPLPARREELHPEVAGEVLVQEGHTDS